MKIEAALLPFISDYSLLAFIAITSVCLAIWALIYDRRK